MTMMTHGVAALSECWFGGAQLQDVVIGAACYTMAKKSVNLQLSPDHTKELQQLVKENLSLSTDERLHIEHCRTESFRLWC